MYMSKLGLGFFTRKIKQYFKSYQKMLLIWSQHLTKDILKLFLKGTYYGFIGM